jgi:hypothetical protein
LLVASKGDWLSEPAGAPPLSTLNRARGKLDWINQSSLQLFLRPRQAGAIEQLRKCDGEQAYHRVENDGRSRKAALETG